MGGSEERVEMETEVRRGRVDGEGGRNEDGDGRGGWKRRRTRGSGARGMDDEQGEESDWKDTGGEGGGRDGRAANVG